MIGRKPVPTALKVLRGNPGKRALPTDEPTPTAVSETAEPPEWLDDAAKTEWRRIAPILARHGLLTELDTDALIAYCEAWTRWREATQKIRQFGMVIKSPVGFPMPSPYLSIANKAMQTMRLLMTEFGMTPSARSRVKSSPVTKAVDPNKERYFGGR